MSSITWQNGKYFVNLNRIFYPKKILSQLENELETKEIIIITCMRQVGKTTLLKYLFSKINSKNKVF